MPSSMVIPRKYSSSAQASNARSHQNLISLCWRYYPLRHFQLWYLCVFFLRCENNWDLLTLLWVYLRLSLHSWLLTGISCWWYPLLNLIEGVAWPAKDLKHQWKRHNSWQYFCVCIMTLFEFPFECLTYFHLKRVLSSSF